MIPQNRNYSGNYSPYPGEYIPPPLAIEEMLEELSKEHEGTTTPLVNIVELPDLFTVEIAAPGLKREDFFVSIHDSILSIYVLHKEPDENAKVYLQHEFNYCCFRTNIKVPEKFYTEFLHARYSEGILSVNLPKAKASLRHSDATVMVY